LIQAIKDPVYAAKVAEDIGLGAEAGLITPEMQEDIKKYVKELIPNP
jgi:hypothetical protein